MKAKMSPLAILSFYIVHIVVAQLHQNQLNYEEEEEILLVEQWRILSTSSLTTDQSQVWHSTETPSSSLVILYWRRFRGMLPSRMVSRMAHTSQHSVAPTWLQNRGTEAGESGDAVVDSDTGKMQKYYDACVNESGSKVPCRIGRGDKYIEVVSSALERCNDPESRRNCTMIFEE